MKLRGCSLALVTAVFLAAPVGDHHSFAVHFVADRLITVRGTVSEPIVLKMEYFDLVRRARP